MLSRTTWAHRCRTAQHEGVSVLRTIESDLGEQIQSESNQYSAKLMQRSTGFKKKKAPFKRWGQGGKEKHHDR